MPSDAGRRRERTLQCFTSVLWPTNSVFQQTDLLARALSRQFKIDYKCLPLKFRAPWQYAHIARAADPVLFHYDAFAAPAASFALRARTAFVYHNHTPARLLATESAKSAAWSAITEMQLRRLPREMEWWAVSRYNAQCLQEYGFVNVRVFPCIVKTPCVSKKATKTLQPEVIFVGRISPHKNVMRLLHCCERVAIDAKTRIAVTIIGTGRALARYTRDVAREIYRLNEGDIVAVDWIQGGVSEAELCERLQRAWLYVSMSKHEGFGLPACEAALNGTPALYLRCGGQEASLGERGATASEADWIARVVELLASEARREVLVRDQHERVSAYLEENRMQEFVDLGQWLGLPLR